MTVKSESAKRPRARRGEGDRLRDEILDVAERLLLEKGDEAAVSIRAVATEVGCTPPAIYLHFEDKDALMMAVCERPFRVFSEWMARAAENCVTPLEVLRALGSAYVTFGLEHPEQYRLMMMTKTEFDPSQHELEEMPGMQAFFALVDATKAAIEAGQLRDMDPFLAAVGLWVAVHGLTSLLISSKNFPWPARERLIEHVVDVQLEGLRAR